MNPIFASANNKVEIATGFYSLSGKTATSNGSSSGIGSYRIGYRRSVSSKLDLGIGYNLLYSSVVTGDAAYGLDVGLHYYPLSLSGKTTYSAGGQTLEVQPDFRPFVNFFFTQRNVQSVQTGYAGFGGGIGAEKTWTSDVSLLGTLRYTSLSGTRSSTATILDVLVGVSWGF